MSSLTFQELAKRIFALYQNKEYAEALDLLTRESNRFPEWARRIYFWRVCLATRMNEVDLALDLLEEAVGSGYWFWKTELREDPDLKPLQGLPRFERLVEICSQRQEVARAQATPSILVSEPEALSEDDRRPWPLLIALHGNNSSAEDSASYWHKATAKGWLLALPQSSQVDGPDTYVWNDRDWTEQEIKDHYNSLLERYSIDEGEVVLAGFSMGGRWAIWLSLNASVKARGFVAVAPFLPDVERFVPLMDIARGSRLRGYIIVGEQDSESCEGARALAEHMRSQDLLCELEVHPDLGHAYPLDFHQSLNRALDFILQS
ncbi:MAG: alpha/beta hydrolase [Candidatus Bathyarchaeia archaeon]